MDERIYLPPAKRPLSDAEEMFGGAFACLRCDEPLGPVRGRPDPDLCDDCNKLDPPAEGASRGASPDDEVELLSPDIRQTVGGQPLDTIEPKGDLL